MKKYLYVHVKLYEFEKTWSFRYLSDEDIYKKGDYVWVQVEDVELPVIVTKSVWYDENEVPWPLDKMKSIIRRSSREEYLKHNEWSILNYILSRLDKNSKLPDDFSLNKYRSLENNFVDGALDGISLFHTDFEEDTDLTKKICDLINNKEEDLIKAVEIFDKSIGDNIIRPSLYSINEYVDNNINELTYEFIYGLAHTMIYRSKNPEVVKLGIFLISNFKISNIDKELYYVFNKMVLCNEFSDLIGGCIFPLYKNTNKLLDAMATSMANTVKWGITSSIFNNITSQIQKAWSYSKSLDTSLNSIRIVTGKSADEMERYARVANKAAKEDDYSSADVILAIRTGAEAGMFIGLSLVILVIVGAGAYLIKKKAIKG